MPKPLRTILILSGIVVFLIGGFIVYLGLIATDTITFTEKTQSIDLPEGRILNIYRISKSEFYNCEFELTKASTGKLLIPRKRFDAVRHFGAGSGTNITTSEHWATYVSLVGTNYGVVGLLSVADQEVVLLLIDTRHAQYVSTWPTQSNKTEGKRLLALLEQEYPGHTLVLEGTEEESKLKKQRFGSDEER